MTVTTGSMGLLQAQGSDNARDYLKTYLAQSLAAIDVHDHSSSKGVPVKRVQNGTFASRPAAGNAGHVYVSNDTNVLSFDNGTTWLDVPNPARSTTFTAAIAIPAGTSYSAAPVTGSLFYRSDMQRLDTFNGTGWVPAAARGAFMDPLQLVHL